MAIFTHAERKVLREAQAAGLPRAVDLMGQAKAADYKGAGISRISNAFVVYTIAKDGTRSEVAKYYFQDDKPRAKRHARWDAESTLKALKRTLGMTESSGPFSALVSKYKAKGWKIHLYHDGETRYELSQIVVPKDSRGMGEGSAFMKGLTHIADAQHLTITVTPSKDFGATSVSRLKRFYKAHGFVENKGKNKAYETRATMYRRPK